jgi:hypothetical protein
VTATKEVKVLKPQVPEFSKEVNVTSIGIGIIQAMDFLANEPRKIKFSKHWTL